MKTFGDYHLEEVPHVETPTGWHCLRCEERIEAGDSGIVTVMVDGEAFDVAEHVECFLRAVVGSVGHLTHKCSCYGGTLEDPPGMTKREAARAAMALIRARGVKPPREA